MLQAYECRWKQLWLSETPTRNRPSVYRRNGLPRRCICTVVKQAYLLYPGWFNIGTKRQQQTDKNSGKFPDVKGIKAEVQNTLIDSLVSLKNKYTSVFQPKKSILTQQKLKIRETYKATIEDLIEKKTM